ncbi:NAD-dependent epimerase/dehydratase family protein [Micromonospora sp. GCM10011542]|uniref:NAD-dependent epimerase/dehydratase family protein n=1 Tax=Micromonospora sp. GCM10011542 TaxID=3317337 RepID=UPI00360AF38F
MRIFIAGGTGVLGRPLVEVLVGQGHEVTASTHRSGNLSVIEAIGARPALMNGLDEAAVRQAVLDAGPDVIINQITALSTPARDYAQWLEMTNRLRSEGTRTLMAAAHEAGTRRVIAQSASFMTQPTGPGPTDESTPLYLDAPEPMRTHVRANVAAETLVLETPGIDGVVLRYGFLYGLGTAIGPGGEWVTAIESGDLPIVGEGAGQYPLVHVRDAVAAAVQAVDRGSPGIYNVVGDEPAAQAEWLPYLAELLGAPAPRRVSEEEAEAQIGVQAVYYGNQLRAASNARAKAELGLNLEYPSWREGFRQLFS